MEFEDGKAVSVRGDKDHPVTRGMICSRGRLMIDHLYHPDRINYPLKRTGKRGAGQWQQISWDLAMDEVSERLDALRNKYGPETLAFTHGTKRTLHWDERRFFLGGGGSNPVHRPVGPWTLPVQPRTIWRDRQGQEKRSPSHRGRPAPH